MISIILYSVGILIGLFLLRIYIQGGQCKLNEKLDGKVIIITGSNTGIGQETAKILAKKGGIIILACRDKKRGSQAEQNIRQQSLSEQVYFRELDLSDFNSIYNFCKQFKNEFTKCDILINNAGVFQPTEKQLTKQGFELQVGTNFLGHLYLTDLLLPFIQNEGRIINVSSGAHCFFKGKIDYENFNSEKSYNKLLQYSISKLAQIYQATYYQQIFDNQKKQIKIVSLHPGCILTDITRNIENNFFIRLGLKYLKPILYFFFKSVESGAQTTIQCALELYSNLNGGAYYSDCKVQNNNYQKDWKSAEKLVLFSKNLIQSKIQDEQQDI